MELEKDYTVHYSDFVDKDGTVRTDCWRCDTPRPIYESCSVCGASCKPLTKEEQRKCP
jgi:hypothetical protein